MRFVTITGIFLIWSNIINAQTPDPWTVYNTPSEIHNMLGKYNGDFVLDITMWTDPAKEPSVYNLLAVNRMILEGRFLEIAAAGKMGDDNYKGLTTIGYNTSTKNYMLTSMTNKGTGILTLEGEGDNKSASLTGQVIDPVTKKPMKVRQKISFIDENNLLIENFDASEGQKEKKTIEYRFRRK
jgi:hypothetical protein